MCMSVPQIAVLWILINTSLCPTFGMSMSFIQMPGLASLLTSAFMARPSFDQLQFLAHPDERRERAIELCIVERRGHLRADARLALGHDRKRKADDVDARGEQLVGEARGLRGVADHHRDDRMFARK